MDGRSPIAINWIRHFAERGDEIYIASTFACFVDVPINGLEITPVAFSALKKPSHRPGNASSRMLRLGSAQALGLRTVIRQWLGPLTIRRASQRLRAFIDRVRPDIIHAMRIPYEGMLTSSALRLHSPPSTSLHSAQDGSFRSHRPDAFSGARFLISVWGNDFTLHAPSSRLMSRYTRQTIQAADALHADCHRDIRLAGEWGLDSSKPTLVAPGNGGIRTDIFYPNAKPVDEPVIINPRGFRPYVRSDSFFKAIPLVLAKQPGAKFICASMAAESQAHQWIRELNIGRAVELLPVLPHREMAKVFRRAQIVLSPSIHDGTPNTLLEGMACGCFPVAGDLESIREWITPNENGLLFDSNRPQSIASAIITAIENKELQNKAMVLNQEIIASRAEYEHNMERVNEFYRKVYK